MEFLSYPWGPSCPAYGNENPVVFQKLQSMAHGHSCNKLGFSGTSHIGTHFDFPYHFDPCGKKLTDYHADEFFHHSVAICWLTKKPGDLLGPADLQTIDGQNRQATLLLVRTGGSQWRQTDAYWNNGCGFDTGAADCLREKLPNLTTMAIDSISISSWKYRDKGHVVHREFLANQARPLLIIEDFNPEPLEQKIPAWVACLPLRIEGGDGAPCTMVAGYEPIG